MAATALDDIDALGADSVRSLVLWARVAPGGGPRMPPIRGRTRRRRGIRYDDLVRGTRPAGWG